MTDHQPAQDPAHDPAHERGMTMRREVLGDAHVDRAVAGTTAFTAPFQDFITRYAWGEVWSRPGLDRRTRSCITLAALTALHARDEIAMHVRAALRNGLTPEEISEVLLHTALYAGLPAANEALAIGRRVLEEEGADPSASSLPSEPPMQPPATPPPAPPQPQPESPQSESPQSESQSQSGQNTCRRCAGSGRGPDGSQCPECGGTGLVVELVGDA